MKILIIENDYACNSHLQDVLSADGHEVFSTFNGAEALSVLENCTVELVISDAAFPWMNGFTFLSLMKSDVQYRAIPFIVYTSRYGARNHEALAYSLGADLYVKKTGNEKDILQAVDAIVTHKK